MYYIFCLLFSNVSKITIIKYCKAVLAVSDRLHAEYSTCVRPFEKCDKKESKKISLFSNSRFKKVAGRLTIGRQCTHMKLAPLSHIIQYSK
jgi:hypothetical protein